MSGRKLTINYNILSGNFHIVRGTEPFIAAADYVRDTHALCLTADESDAVLWREQFIGGGGCLPPIVSLPRLVAVAAAGVHAQHLWTTAQQITAPASRRRLTMNIYALLRDDVRPPSSALSLSESLSALFEEFIDEYPTLTVAADALPQLCQNMGDDYRLEAAVAAALWEILASDDLLLARKTLATFAAAAPPLAYIGRTTRRPWHDDFLQQCVGGCTVFEIAEKQTPGVEDILNGGRLLCPQIVRCRQAFSASTDGAAKLALSAVQDFAAANKSTGVVVYDRLLARRLRAVAENVGIHIEDDGGWRAETLSYGAALQQWAAAVENFSPPILSVLLSPPFWANHPRRAIAEQSWRRRLAGENALPHAWEDISSGEDFFVFAEAMVTARRCRPQHASLSEWLNWLSTESAAALAAWQHDAVAARLRAVLFMAATDDRVLAADEFNIWLEMMMRVENGGARDIKSSICFVPPSTSRRFEALLLLGARDGNLPPPPPSINSFFGEKGRQLIGLPTRREHIERQLTQFSRLLAAHTDIAAVWQSAEQGGQPVLPSPFWILFTEAVVANNKTVEEIPPPVEVMTTLNIQPPPPSAVRIRHLPTTVSVTAAVRLMRCPYHCFAVDVLQLGEDDGDETLTPAGRGRLLHRAMKQFITAAGEEQEAANLLTHWRAAFMALPAHRAETKMMIQHWLAQGESFVKTEAERRQAGWRPQHLEFGVNATMVLRDGTLSVRGRIDRADFNGETWTVTDYKSGGGANQKQMRAGEDPQLPLYAFLLGQPTAEWRVCYPANDKTTATEGDSTRIAARLRTVVRQIAIGAPMPANGVDSVCAKCESRRLCRRDHWQAAVDANSPRIGKIAI